MAYSDINDTVQQEGGVRLRRNPARMQEKDADEGGAQARESVSTADAHDLDEGMPVQSRRARRRAAEQCEDGEEAPVRTEPVKRVPRPADALRPEEPEPEADEYEDEGDSEPSAPRRWLRQGMRRLRSRRPSEDEEYYEADEPTEEEPPEDEQPEYEPPVRARHRLLRSRDAEEPEQYADDYASAQAEEDEEEHEEAPMRRRYGRRSRPSATAAQAADDREYDRDEPEARRSPSRSASRKVRAADQYEQYDPDEDEYDGGAESHDGGRYDDYADEEDEPRPRWGLGRLFGRRSEDDEYEDDGYDERPSPRNRIMAWLESMRIIEEVPEEEYEPEYADQDYDPEADGRDDEPPQESARSARRVPVPQGRQMRGSSGRSERARSAVERRQAVAADDEYEYDERRDQPEPVERRAVRRGAQAGVRMPRDSARAVVRDVEEEADEQPEYDAPDVADGAAQSAEADAPEQPTEPTGGAQQADEADERADDELDADAHTSRRQRRNPGEPAQSAAEQAPASTAAEDDLASELQARYKAADLKGKRALLLEYWRKQFIQSMVIPAKPEKVRALEDMVRGILDACADEYALGERWEKVEGLLAQYSSAVVAEYGYKQLYESVRSEEQQRMYGRPSEYGNASGSSAQREVKVPTPMRSAQPERSAARAASAGDSSDAQPERAEPVRPPRTPELKQQPRAERHPAHRAYEEYDYSDISSREGEYIDGASRRTSREYEYDGGRRTGGAARAHAQGRGSDSGYGYAPGASAKAWLRHMFKRGDVLDYSSDEPETAQGYDDDRDGELTSARVDAMRSDRGRTGSSYSNGARAEYEAATRSEGGSTYAEGYSRSETPKARPDNSSRVEQPTYSRSDDYARSEQPTYSRSNDYSRSEQPTYSRSDDYSRSEQPTYSRSDDYSRSEQPTYSRSDDYSRSEQPTYSRSDDYARSEQSTYSRAGDYSRSEQPTYSRPDDYARKPEREADILPLVDRSVYNRDSADYSADRPDYSHEYVDNDYMSDGYGDSVQSGYYGGYTRDSNAGDGRYGGRYASSPYTDVPGHLRADNYDAQYARLNPAGGAREYRTRPQSERPVQEGDGAEDRWRRCSPTKDDRGGMGAPHGCTEYAARAARALSGLLFAEACADEERDRPERKAGRAHRSSGKARLRLGGSVRGGRRWLMLVGAYALLAAAMATACGLRVVHDVRRYEDRFYEGIYLDGIALEGMTLEEAAQTVALAGAPRVEAISLSVRYGEHEYSLDSAGLGVELDAQERLAELWKLGREGGYAQRYGQIARLRDEGVRAHTSWTYSERALDDFLDGIKADVDLAPRDAQIEFHPNASDKFDIAPSAVGREVDITALGVDARAALAAGGGSVELAPRQLEPEFTTAQARACTVELVSYSTPIRSSNAARTSNVRLALGFYHGLEVQPGQQVDFNKLVGNRTEARGFKPAPEYSNGEIVEGIGGGVCQASTTLYGALLRAGMRIDERYSHSMTVGYVPLSQDAAVVYPGKTLAFTNVTGYPAFFATSVTSSRATVTIYGYDLYPGKSVSIVSETISVDRASVKTYADPTYQYTTQPGEEVMVTTPSDGVTSRAYRVLTDDATGREVSRESLGQDAYRRRDGVIYRGGQ